MVWVGFVVFILLMLALDLGVLQRNPHSVTMREALIRCAGWISLGLSFGIFVHLAYDHQWFGLGVAVDSVDDRERRRHGLGEVPHRISGRTT